LNAFPGQVPGLTGKMDFDRIGVGGHSYGAYTAQVIGGSKADPMNTGTVQSYRDPRVRSVLAMSPFGAGAMTFTTSSWNEFTTAMMLITGSRDRSPNCHDPASRLDSFRLSPPGHKYVLYIDGANHLSFPDATSGFSFMGARPLSHGEINTYVKAGSLAFWDETLKDNDAAAAYLHSNDMAQSSSGAINLSCG
jgi:predicted dienelactone hydrolase